MGCDYSVIQNTFSFIVCVCVCVCVFVCMCVCVFQERIIERLKDQREREDRERLEEVESYKKENKDLKEKVNSLQIELTEKEVSAWSQEIIFLCKDIGVCSKDSILYTCSAFMFLYPTIL